MKVKRRLGGGGEGGNGGLQKTGTRIDGGVCSRTLIIKFTKITPNFSRFIGYNNALRIKSFAIIRLS
jgi:hypothetical protein